MEIALFILYLCLSYWAVGKTLWRNKVIIAGQKIFLQKMIIGILAGPVIVPIALVMKFFGK